MGQPSQTCSFGCEFIKGPNPMANPTRHQLGGMQGYQDDFLE